MLNIIVIVEDKEEEQQNALSAIKAATGDDQEVYREEILSGSPIITLKSQDSDNSSGTMVHFAADPKTAKFRIGLARGIAWQHVGHIQIGAITDNLIFPVEEIEGFLPVAVCDDKDWKQAVERLAKLW